MNYMHYRSTRGGDKKVFADILSSGLAADGGLYEPTSWPHHRRLRGFFASNPTFPQVVGAVVGVFAGRRSLPQLDFTAIAHKAFETFRSRAVVPMREVERNLWLLELFHGPTLSFKDIPLQFYGQLLEALASERKRLLIMIGATSGDTGSAAIEALRHVRGVRLFMLHPKDRISALQRKQMTCVQAPHICNIAVEGSYDDCLRLVKKAAQSEAIQARGQIAAVNSFNWIRIAVQSAVYLYAAQQMPRHAKSEGKSIRFALASGNFGNAYAGYVAKKLGAKIEGLTLAVSHNDFLHNLFQHGSAAKGEVVPSLAPSIDIMTPNNIERLLFRSLGESARKWNKVREQAQTSGTLQVPKAAMRSSIFQFFRTQRFDDEQILEAMSKAYDSVGEPLDPHSAIALKAAQDAHSQSDKGSKSKNKGHDLFTIAFATASAAKFPETIERAIGARPHIPQRLAELETRAEAFETIAVEDEALESIIVERLKKPLDSDTGLQAGEETVVAVAATTIAATAAAAVLPTSEQAQSDTDTVGANGITTETATSETATATATEAAPKDGKENNQEENPETIEQEGREEEREAADSSPFASLPPSMPEMPAVAALTAEEDSLEKKIAKLKEQTARLDENLEEASLGGTRFGETSFGEKSLEDPALTPSSALADDPFATPSTSPIASPLVTPSTSPPLASPFATSTPFDDAPNTEAMGEEASLGEMTETQAETETMASETIESEMTANTMTEGATVARAITESVTMASEMTANEMTASKNVDTGVSSSDEIVSLADAAEQGHASLQEKIAKLKEQSARLDEASEEMTEGTSGFVGAENFFSQPAASAETTEASATASPEGDPFAAPSKEGNDKS